MKIKIDEFLKTVETLTRISLENPYSLFLSFCFDPTYKHTQASSNMKIDF